MKVKGHEIAKSRAAGMAAATRGRSRRFDDKADLLEQACRAASLDLGVGVRGMAEARRGQVRPRPAMNAGRG